MRLSANPGLPPKTHTSSLAWQIHCSPPTSRPCSSSLAVLPLGLAACASRPRSRPHHSIQGLITQQTAMFPCVYFLQGVKNSISSCGGGFASVGACRLPQLGRRCMQLSIHRYKGLAPYKTALSPAQQPFVPGRLPYISRHCLRCYPQVSTRWCLGDCLTSDSNASGVIPRSAPIGAWEIATHQTALSPVTAEPRRCGGRSGARGEPPSTVLALSSSSSSSSSAATACTHRKSCH